MQKPEVTPETTYRYAQAIKGSVAFAKAMIAAKRAGLERVKVGVVTDDSPMVPSRIDRPPTLSCMTSSAACCADEGLDTGAQGLKI